MKLLLTSVFFLLLSLGIYAQSDQPLKEGGRFLSATVNDQGDTIPYVFMKEYYVWARRSFKSKSEERKYSRLEKKVKTVYPYARKASALLRKYEAQMSGVEDRKTIKNYYRQVEKELWDEYGQELTDLSVSEGRILIKLIDRETERTSYELVKELRSGFTAFVFQGMARMFGHNLKSEYNAADEDKYIEEIVLAIQLNQI